MKISIVTICYNSSQYISQTIESVITQTYQDREYIVIDGGSTDGTVDIIRKYEGQIDYWESEADNGIADAMNKGLAKAKGDYIIFLHSDDYFVNKNILTTIVRHMGEMKDIYLFDIYLEKNGKKRLHHPRGLNWWMNLKTGVFHQSAICRRELFDQIGNFDLQFKIAMDYDFFLRAYRLGIETKTVNIPISVMRDTGVSSRLDWDSLETRFTEEKNVHFKNCSNNKLKYLYRLFWHLYLPYRKIRYLMSA